MIVRQEVAMTLWDEVLKHIAPRVNPYSFKTWFAPAEMDRLEGNRLILRVPTPHFQKRLTETYGPMIKIVLTDMGKPDVQLDFISDEAPRLWQPSYPTNMN
jgi:chromosomal replication initiation ATPase DnaA